MLVNNLLIALTVIMLMISPCAMALSRICSVTRNTAILSKQILNLNTLNKYRFKFSHRINAFVPPTQHDIPSRFFSSAKETDVDIEDNSLKGKVKVMWKKYGYISIGTYFGLYVTTLSSIFVLLDFDLVNASSFGFDPIETIKKVRLNTLLIHTSRNVTL